MLELAASVVVLAVLSAAGVAALRRFAPALTTLETVAYGAVLGTVCLSLLILLLARAVGLTVATLGAFAAAVAVLVALGLTAAAGEPRSLPSPGTRVPALVADIRAHPRAWLPLAVVGLVILRWALFWTTAITHEGGGLVAGHVNVFGDWPVHLGIATSFAYGENFPPEHPRFAGHPLAYHHLADLTGAALVSLGMDPVGALLLHSAAFSAVVALALFAFVRRLTADPVIASAALVLFVAGGSLAWVHMLGVLSSSPDPVGARLWEFDTVRDTYQWHNIFYGFLMPQRAFLYGIPLALLSLTLMLIGLRGRSAVPFVAAGAVLGLLPLAHLATMLAIAIVTPFAMVLLPTRRWLYFFAAWMLVAVPQLLLQQGGGPGALSAMRLQLGWVTGDTPWPIFWFVQVGFFLPLLVAALALPRLLPRDSYRLLLSFMSIFVVANVLVFQPWDWDNHKVLVYWFLATCILVATLLVAAWRRYGLPVRAAIACVVVTMLLSGVLEDLNQALGRDRHGLLTAEEIAFAYEVVRSTPPDAIFAAGSRNNHPVPVLAGRRVVMGYSGWLFAEGLPWEAREADLRALYALAPNTDAIVERYDIEYVVVGPDERETFGADPAEFRERYESVLRTDNYELFAVGTG